MASEDKTRHAKRLLPRFSLRVMLAIVTVFAVWLGLYARRVKRQQFAIASIQEFGGWIRYDYQLVDNKFDPNGTSQVPKWLRDWLGDDYFHSVVEVNFSFTEDTGSRSDNQNMDPAPLESLAGLTELTGLLLHGNQANDDNLVHLRNFPKLKRLFMWDANDVTDDGLANVRTLNHLRVLHVSDSKITDKSLRMLSRLTAIERLSLQFGHFTNAGVQSLAALKHLESLWVCGKQTAPNEISDESLAFLLTLPDFHSLGVQETNVTKAFEDDLKTRFPKCRVFR